MYREGGKLESEGRRLDVSSDNEMQLSWGAGSGEVVHGYEIRLGEREVTGKVATGQCGRVVVVVSGVMMWRGCGGASSEVGT